MPMKMQTPAGEIAAYIAAGVERRMRAAVRLLCVAGEKAVGEARANHTYRDRTGNLTSSIGYIVARDGAVVSVGSFNAVIGGAGGAETGEAYARSLVSRYAKGLVLILVAGMNYAAYVSARGYNVIDTAEQVARREVDRLMRQLSD